MEIKTELQTRENKEGIIIIEPSGELALESANELRTTVKAKIGEAYHNILINLSKVNYIDSSGIGVLVSSLAYLKKHNGKLKLSGLHGNVQKMFEFSKLDMAFSIFKDKEEALESWD